MIAENRYLDLATFDRFFDDDHLVVRESSIDGCGELVDVPDFADADRGSHVRGFDEEWILEITSGGFEM